MKSKRTKPARPGERQATAPRPRRAPNPLTPDNRRLGKRLLQFYDLPEPDRSRAFNAWLNAAGSPQRNDERRQQVREFLALMQALAKKLSPRDRAALRALGKAIRAKAAR